MPNENQNALKLIFDSNIERLEVGVKKEIAFTLPLLTRHQAFSNSINVNSSDNQKKIIVFTDDIESLAISKYCLPDSLPTTTAVDAMNFIVGNQNNNLKKNRNFSYIHQSEISIIGMPETSYEDVVSLYLEKHIAIKHSILVEYTSNGMNHYVAGGISNLNGIINSFIEKSSDSTGFIFYYDSLDDQSGINQDFHDKLLKVVTSILHSIDPILCKNSLDLIQNLHVVQLEGPYQIDNRLCAFYANRMLHAYIENMQQINIGNIQNILHSNIFDQLDVVVYSLKTVLQFIHLFFNHRKIVREMALASFYCIANFFIIIFYRKNETCNNCYLCLYFYPKTYNCKSIFDNRFKVTSCK